MLMSSLLALPSDEHFFTKMFFLFIATVSVCLEVHVICDCWYLLFSFCTWPFPVPEGLCPRIDTAYLCQVQKFSHRIHGGFSYSRIDIWLKNLGVN